MKTTITFILLFMCLSISAQKQTNDSIVTFKNKLLFRAKITNQNKTFTIVEGQDKFNVEALNSFKLQLATNYKFVGFGVSFSPINKNSKFSSDFFESELRFFIDKHWIQTFNYSKIKGFKRRFSNNPNSPINFPNLKTVAITGNTSYVLNPQFSLKHLLNQNEWQKKSAGSLVPSLEYGLNKIIDVVDSNRIVQNNFDFLIHTAYYYTWCFKTNWFVSTYLSPALGIRFSTDKLVDTKTRETDLIKTVNLGLQYGYTSNKISAGATFNFITNKTNSEFVRQFNNSKNNVNIYFTYRMEPPKFLKRKVANLEKKLGI